MRAPAILGRILLFASLALLLLVLALWSGHRWIRNWGEISIEILEPVEFRLERGMSLRRFAHLLDEKELIGNAKLFEIWVRLFSDYRAYQAGPYRFVGSVSPRTIDRTIRNGEIYRPIVFEITVPEGFTAAEIFKKAASLGMQDQPSFHDPQLIRELRERFPKLPESLEGYLFPATYQFTTVPTVVELAGQMVATFFERLPAHYEEQLAARNLTLQQGVTIASLIEREASHPEELSMVAEVIYNRLKRRMALAIDASTIYGIPDFDGNLRRRHLDDRQNTYNTRIHPGLPPTPICSPGVPALRAVISPSEYGYLYYVVDADDFSRHRFARTLQEHNRNVSLYWKARRESEKRVAPNNS